MFLDKRDLIEVEYRYQLSKGIFDIVDIKTDERFVVRFSPLHIEKDIEEMARYLEWAKCRYLQTYKSTVTLDPHFTGQSFGVEEMENFRKIWNKRVNMCKIRG